MVADPSGPMAGPRRNTIRCPKCLKSAQLSEESAAVVSDRLKPHLDRVTSVPVTDPNGHDRVLAEIPLGVLCPLLSQLGGTAEGLHGGVYFGQVHAY